MATEQEEYTCPKEAVLIDFTDKITKERTVFCQIRKDGKLLKDGAQLTFNSEGRIIKKDFFKDGVSIKGQRDKGVEVTTPLIKSK